MIVTMSPDELTDARSRLVSGLKRYFRSKRFQGLLSVKVRLLGAEPNQQQWFVPYFVLLATERDKLWDKIASTLKAPLELL